MLTKAQHDSRSGNQCRDYWPNSQCKRMANLGKCAKDSITRKYCKRTCNLCPCSDNLSSCKTYAKYCNTNDNVKVNCQFTCNFCGGNTTTTTTTSKATTTTAAPCKDKISSNSCKSYAAKGYCTKYSKMKRDCPKTCKFCGGNSTTTSTTTTKTTAKTTTTTAKPCKDNKSNCKKWAAKGLCTKNGYVKRNCKKSCNFCGGSTSTTTKPKTCKDKISCCKELAGQGYCKYSFIKPICKKSCGATC